MNWHRTSKKIARYLRDGYPQWRNATMRSLRDYLRWYWQRDLMAVVWNRGKIVALCLIRLHNDPAQFAFPFRHDPLGAICWVDRLVAENGAWAVATIAKFTKMHADNTTFAGLFMWAKNDTRAPKCYTYDRFKKLLLRLTYGSP